MLSFSHIRHLNLLKINPERIKKADKNMVNDLDYEEIEFPVSKNKDFAKIGKKNNIWINIFVMKIVWFILFIYQTINLEVIWICWW